MMEIRNHRIDEIWYETSSNLSSGTITPRVLVMHYTTGWSGTGSRDWLLGAAGGTSNTGSSAHVVIDRDGTAWQIAPFNRKAWHAGPSRYGSLTNLNSHSIGIEFVNPGWLKPAGGDNWIDAFGNQRTAAQLNDFGGYTTAPHPRVGGDVYAWPFFPEAQLAKGDEIAMAIVHKYNIEAIVSHEVIDTRGWKTDPGPAFPMDRYLRLIDPLSDEQEHPVYSVDATRLNIRGGPAGDAERIDPPGSVPEGTTVRIHGLDGDWAFVEVIKGKAKTHKGLKGWVAHRYLRRQF